MIPKASIGIVFEKIIRLPLAYFTLIYTSRLFAPDEFGAYSLAIAISSLLFTLTDLGLSQNLLALSSYPKDKQIELIRATMLLKFLANGIAGVALFVACIFQPQSIVIKSLFVLSLANLLLTLPTSMRQYLLDKKCYYVINSSDVVSSWSLQLLKYVFASLGFSVVYQAAAQLVSVILQAIVLSRASFTRHLTIAKVSLSTLKSSIFQSKEYLFSSIVVFLYVKADQVILAAMHGNASLAPYSLSVMIIESTMVLYPVITSIFSTAIGANNNIEAQKSIIKMNACLYLVGISVFIVTLVFAFWLVPVLFALKYPNLQANILILSPCMLIAALTSSLILQFQHEGRRHEILLANTVTALASILFSVPMIYYYKSIGASLATTLSSAALPLVLTYFALSRSKNNLGRFAFF
jgi:O-antigen/teichoic acid export membrane protein